MIDWNGLPERVNHDPEFKLAGRFWTATVRLDMGSTSVALRFEHGVLAGAAECGSDADADLFVRAPEPDWRELLAPCPRPFYQDLFGAQLHHDVELSPDPIAYAAYYPALRRLIQLMSAARREARA